MTLIIVAITAIISILAFNREGLFYKLMMNPYQVHHRKEYYRLFTHGFLHADWVHLIINMLVLFSFGSAVERYFGSLESNGMIQNSSLMFLVLYLSGIIISSLSTQFKHKNNPQYNSVGASGAVSAVLFTSIFFAPFQKVLFYAVIPIPGIIFGVLYLVYSQYMTRKNSDNINHDAHFVGAVYGLIFPILLEPSLFSRFINEIMSFNF